MSLNEPKHQTKPHPLSFSSLPDEIVENCLARISRSKYPFLSLVSKKFLSILSSPELYTTRSRTGNTEPCIYFSLELPNEKSPKWFALWIKPDDDDETLTEFIPYNYSLLTLPSHRSPRHVPYYSTVVGSDIYLIGAPYKTPPSAAVRILDCRSHTWRDGPDMLVDRESAQAAYLDGKIYVMGGCGKDEPWMEVLDVKTQTWTPLLLHGANEISNELAITSVVTEGEIYGIADEKDYTYDPKEGTWKVVGTHSSIIWIDEWCVIENIMYCYTSSGFCMWFDSKSRAWVNVNGPDLERLRMERRFSLNLHWGCVGLCNHGGKLLVMWVRNFKDYKGRKERRLRCAKIALEKRHGGEVWGKVEWKNTVFTFPKKFDFFVGAVVSI